MLHVQKKCRREPPHRGAARGRRAPLTELRGTTGDLVSWKYFKKDRGLEWKDAMRKMVPFYWKYTSGPSSGAHSRGDAWNMDAATRHYKRAPFLT